MSKTFTYLLAFTTILFLSCQAKKKDETFVTQAAISVPKIDPEKEAFEKEIKAFERKFQQALAANHCPGAALAIIKDTSIVYIKGFGVKERHSRDSVGVNTVFRLGSLSKGFSGVLAAQLVEKKCFNWEDKVVDFLPNFKLRSPEQTKNVCVRHLLSHTVGFHSHAYTNLIEMGLSLERIELELRKVKLTHKEGQSFAYQNVAFSLIERIAEMNTGGKKFGALLNENIFSPLCLDRTTTTFDAIDTLEDKSFPHTPYGAPLKITNKYYNCIAAGGINSSISDMSKWLEAMLGNHPDIISPNALNAAFTPRICTNAEYRRFNRTWKGVENSYYGYGWWILDYGAYGNLVYHGGYVNGYRGEIAVDRKNKIAICALFNADVPFSDEVVPAFLEQFSAWRVRS